MLKEEAIAIKKLYDYLGISYESIEPDMEYGYLTINEDLMNGGEYAWYFDGAQGAAININTLEITEEVYNEL